MLTVQGHRRKQLFLNTSVLRILQNKVQRYLTELWRVRMLEQSYEKTIIKLKRAWELLVYLLIKTKNITWRSYRTVCLEGYDLILTRLSPFTSTELATCIWNTQIIGFIILTNENKLPSQRSSQIDVSDVLGTKPSSKSFVFAVTKE